MPVPVPVPVPVPRPFRGALLEGLIPAAGWELTTPSCCDRCCQPTSLNARLSAVTSVSVQVRAFLKLSCGKCSWRRWLIGGVLAVSARPLPLTLFRYSNPGCVTVRMKRLTRRLGRVPLCRIGRMDLDGE